MKAVVIGAGIGGLSTALYLSKKGFEVTVLEKLDRLGGRARGFSSESGEFSFDMGPSWYLMPEVFQRFYKEVGEEPPEVVEVSPLFSLHVGKLEKKERSAEFWKDKIPLKNSETYLEEVEFMYKLAMERFLFKEMKIVDFLDPAILKNLKRFPIFTSLDAFNRRYFQNDDFSLKAMGFSSVFLGGSPFNTPAVYAMVNYAIYKGGVYYPKGGFQGLVERLYNLCKKSGVEFKFNSQVNKIEFDGKVKAVWYNGKKEEGDVFVFNADYHYVDSLLPYEYTGRGEDFWRKKKIAPSALLVYLGVEGEVNSPHHSIFINGDWKVHFDSIVQGTEPDPNNMSYYVSYRGSTDRSISGKDLVFLIPIAPGLSIPQYQRYVDLVVRDFKTKTNSEFQIRYQRIYKPIDFELDYNAYKGTAFGISHTLDQTGPFRLPMQNKKLPNLFYVGQYTQPGIGVPMVTISSIIVGEKVLNYARK